MSNRNAESIAKEISNKMVERSALINQAKEIVIKEIAKYDTFSCVLFEEENTILIKGSQYGKYVLDLNFWFDEVNESYPPEKLARDMMSEIKSQLVPDKVISM